MLTHAHDFSRTSATQEVPLGLEVVAWDDSNSCYVTWIYVKNGTVGAFTIGRALVPVAGTEPRSVKEAAITDHPSEVVGFPRSALASGYYGWIVRKGKTTVRTDNTVTANTAITLSDNASYPGRVKDVGAVIDPALGYALATDAGADTLVSAYVNCQG